MRTFAGAEAGSRHHVNTKMSGIAKYVKAVSDATGKRMGPRFLPVELGIPAKLNSIPAGSRTPFRGG
jgi:hypothetical protein